MPQDRRSHFDKALSNFRRDVAEELPPEHTQPIEEALAQVRERVFEESLANISEFHPAREYKQQARAALADAIQSTLSKERAAFRARKDAEKQELLVQLTDAVHAIDRVLEDIDANRRIHHRYIKTWRGADVIIGDRPIPNYRGGSTVVVTAHAAALAALFCRLRDDCSDVLDYMTKYEFFGEAAEAARALIEEEPEVDEFELLRRTAIRAREVVLEWIQRVHLHNRI